MLKITKNKTDESNTYFSDGVHKFSFRLHFTFLTVGRSFSSRLFFDKRTILDRSQLCDFQHLHFMFEFLHQEQKKTPQSNGFVLSFSDITFFLNLCLSDTLCQVFKNEMDIYNL